MGLWWVYCGSMVGLLCVYGGSIVGLWRVYGGTMVGLWWVYGGAMVGLWWDYGGSRVGPWCVHAFHVAVLCVSAVQLNSGHTQDLVYGGSMVRLCFPRSSLVCVRCSTEQRTHTVTANIIIIT